MAKGIVDALEVVDVDEQQAQARALAQQVFKPLHQIMPVCQMRQRIVMRQESEVLFGFQAFADIAQQEQIVLRFLAPEGCAADFQWHLLAAA